MQSSIGYGGIPVGAKARMIMSVISGVFFGFLLVMASVNFKWFTLIRGLYLILGIANGIILGLVEAQSVIRGLNTKHKVVVWQPLPISALTFALPFLVTIAVFGVSEYLPFGIYVVLSAIPVYYGITGWIYNRAETQNKIRYLMSIYGFKFWKEPVPDYSNLFSSFISDLARKDYFLIMNPHGYLGNSKRLMSALEAKTNADPETKDQLMNVIQFMDKYRQRGLQLYAAVMVSMTLLGLWIFLLASTNTFGLQHVVNGRIVSGREISLVMGLVPAAAFFIFSILAPRLHWKRYQRTLLRLLANVDTDKVYSIL